MPHTIVQMLLGAVTSSGSNPLLIGLQIIIFFLLLSMLIYYGEEIWDSSSGRFRTLFRPRSGDSQRLRITPFIR